MGDPISTCRPRAASPLAQRISVIRQPADVLTRSSVTVRGFMNIVNVTVPTAVLLSLALTAVLTLEISQSCASMNGSPLSYGTSLAF